MFKSKTVKQVFIIIGALVACFLIWQLFFTSDGILVTAYNALADGINSQYAKIAGRGKTLIPKWNAEQNGTGFEVGTE